MEPHRLLLERRIDLRFETARFDLLPLDTYRKLEDEELLRDLGITDEEPKKSIVLLFALSHIFSVEDGEIREQFAPAVFVDNGQSYPR
jgi:hypothetical protein